MASQVTPKKNAAFTFYVGLVSQANTKVLQGSATLAAGDVKVSTDGGALNNITTLPVVTPAAGKAIKVDCSAAEMNGDNIVVLFSDAAGAEWCDLLINLQTTARQVDDLAFPATPGRSMVVDAAGLVDANMVKAGPTGAGTAQTAGDIIADTNDIQARLPAALTVDGNIKADSLRVGGTLQTAGDIIGDTNDIQARLPAALTAAGNLKADVEEWRAAVPNALTNSRIPVASNVQKNAALANYEFLMTDNTNHSPMTGAVVSVTRSIDGGAFAAGTLSAPTEVANGIYFTNFGAADLNGNVIVLRATATGADDTFERLMAVP